MSYGSMTFTQGTSMTDDLPPPTHMSQWLKLTDPADWPHTPPLEVYRELEKTDPNLFWRMAHGDAQNLLDEAIDRLERVEKLTEKWEQDADEVMVDLGGGAAWSRQHVRELRAALAGESE